MPRYTVTYEFDTEKDYLDHLKHMLLFESGIFKKPSSVDDSSNQTAPQKEEPVLNVPVSKAQEEKVKPKASGWTPEMRKAASERMKAIRRARPWSTKPKSKQTEKQKPKEAKPKAKAKATPKKRSTAGWTPEKRKAAGDRMRARIAAKKAAEAKADEDSVPYAQKPREIKLPKGVKKTKGSGGGSPKVNTPKKPKGRPIGEMFSGIYDAMKSAIEANSTADTNALIESVEATESEREMATEVVQKLMRAAAANSNGDFVVGEGDNPTLLCLSQEAVLPSLDILRAY